jgi:hypothetical protein
MVAVIEPRFLKERVSRQQVPSFFVGSPIRPSLSKSTFADPRPRFCGARWNQKFALATVGSSLGAMLHVIVIVALRRHRVCHLIGAKNTITGSDRPRSVPTDTAQPARHPCSGLPLDHRHGGYSMRLLRSQSRAETRRAQACRTGRREAGAGSPAFQSGGLVTRPSGS